MTKRTSAVCACAWAFLATPPAPALQVRVTSPGHACRDLPMSVALPAGMAMEGKALVKPDDTEVAGQTVVDGDSRTLHWVLDELPAGETLTYTIRQAGKPAQAGNRGIAMTAAGNDVSVTVNGEPFTTYLAMSGHKPICYPLFGPKGKAMTRSFPMGDAEGEKRDHPHHRSFWFTHGDVNGTDFWSESAKAGRIVQTSIKAVGGRVLGSIVTTNDWVDRAGKRVCSDRRTMAVYNVATGRLFDMTVTISAVDGPVEFGDTKEGSFGFRTASSMKPSAKKGGIVVNAHGNRDGAAWGKQAPWVDASGPVDGDVVGIAILEHPSSFRAPTYWHARTYGLVAANPFGLHHFLRDNTKDGSHTIAQGESITFRFRVWLHEGHAAEAGVGPAWEQYANPPKALLVQ